MLYTLLTFLLLAAPLAAQNATTSNTQQTKHKEIRGDQLKAWYDQNKPMTVLDARSGKYFDGTMLPKAIWMPSETSEKKMQSQLPSKSSLIVVYCSNTKCPASGWLYDKLTSLGYTNVYEYHEGLEDWMNRGFPTIQQ